MYLLHLNPENSQCITHQLWVIFINDNVSLATILPSSPFSHALFLLWTMFFPLCLYQRQIIAKSLLEPTDKYWAIWSLNVCLVCLRLQQVTRNWHLGHGWINVSVLNVLSAFLVLMPYAIFCHQPFLCILMHLQRNPTHICWEISRTEFSGAYNQGGIGLHPMHIHAKCISGGWQCKELKHRECPIRSCRGIHRAQQHRRVNNLLQQRSEVGWRLLSLCLNSISPKLQFHGSQHHRELWVSDLLKQRLEVGQTL